MPTESRISVGGVFESGPQTATRRYVRRQESWFGADPRVQWFESGSAGLVDRVLDAVLAVVTSEAHHPGQWAHD